MSSAADATGILVYRLEPQPNKKGKKKQIKHKSRYRWLQVFPAARKGHEPVTLPFLRGQNFDFRGAHKKHVNRKVFRMDDVIVVDRRTEGDELAMYIADKLLGAQGKLYYRASLKDRKGKAQKVWVLLNDPAQPFPRRLKDHVKPPPHVIDISGEVGDVIAVRPTGLDVEELKAAAQTALGEDGQDFRPYGSDRDDYEPGDPIVQLHDHVTAYTYTLVTSEAVTNIDLYDYQWLLCTTDGVANDEDPIKVKATKLRAWLKNPQMRAFDRVFDAFEDNVEECLEQIRAAARDVLAEPSSEKKKSKLRYAAEVMLDQTVPSTVPGSTAPQGSLSTIGDIAGSTSLKEYSSSIASLPETIASGTAFIIDIKTIIEGQTEKGDRPWLYTDAVDHLAKTVMSGAKFYETVVVLDHLVKEGKAPAAATPAAGVAGVIGVLTGALATVRSSISFRRATRCNGKLATVYMQMHFDNTLDPPREITHLLSYALKKSRRRTDEHYGGIMAGVLGTLGGAVGIALLAGAAVNIWNPIGWTLAAVGLVVGLAIVGVKLDKRIGRHRRHKRLRKQGYPATIDDFSRKIMRILQDPNTDVLDRYYAGSILDCFGIKVLWFETAKDLEDWNAPFKAEGSETNRERFKTLHGYAESDAPIYIPDPKDTDPLSYDDDADVPDGVESVRDYFRPDDTSVGTAVPFDLITRQYGWYERVRRRARKKIERALT